MCPLNPHTTEMTGWKILASSVVNILLTLKSKEFLPWSMEWACPATMLSSLQYGLKPGR